MVPLPYVMVGPCTELLLTVPVELSSRWIMLYPALRGGLPSLRHNEIRDLTARLLTEVCHQVQVEPVLQPVSDPGSFALATANTQEGAHLDIAVNGFWGVRRNAVLWM